MAEIIAEPTALSKVIPLKFKINDVDVPKTTQLSTNKQFNTTDTDAWFTFELDGLASTSGTYDLTLINLDDKSIFHHADVIFPALPFHYKLNSSEDVTLNEIRHAGRWLGQLVVTLSNGDTTARQFGFNIAGHILDGQDAQVILLSDYQALINTINLAKDDLAQYNVDYAALLVDIAAAEDARVTAYNQLLADQQANIEAFDVALDEGIVAANLATKLQDFEATNNSRLLSAEQQLEHAVTVSDTAALKADAMASGSPKGVYATLTLLQAAYPTGTTGAYLVAADGKWYYWSGSAWAAGGTYQSTGISDGSVTRNKTTFYKAGGINKFDKTAVSPILVNENTGAVTNSSIYSTSDYIPVLAGDVVRSGGGGSKSISWFDTSRVWIGGVYPIPAEGITIAQDGFIRHTVPNANVATCMTTINAPIPGVYEPFKVVDETLLIKNSNLHPDFIITPEDVQGLGDEITDTLESAKGEYINAEFIKDIARVNLLNKDDLTSGVVISTTTGAEVVDANYLTSKFLDVRNHVGSHIISNVGSLKVAQFDKDGVFITGGTGGVTTNRQIIHANAYTFKYSIDLNTFNSHVYHERDYNGQYMAIWLGEDTEYTSDSTVNGGEGFELYDERGRVIVTRQPKVLKNHILSSNANLVIYNAHNDLNANRRSVPRIFVDHILGLSDDKGVTFSNGKDYLELPPSVIAGNSSQVIKTDKFKSEKYLLKNPKFNVRTVKSSIGASVVPRVLFIGDSITAGVPQMFDGIGLDTPYWGQVKRLFEMDKVDNGDVGYDIKILGGDTIPFNYNGITRTLKGGKVAIGGYGLTNFMHHATLIQPSAESWALLGLDVSTGQPYTGTLAQKELIRMTPQYGYPSVGEGQCIPFYDENATGATTFSILRYLQRYRTMDDNGVRLTWGDPAIGTYIGSQEELNTYDVCTPTHIVLQHGRNDELYPNAFKDSLAQFISVVKAEIPTCKIGICIPPNNGGTIFPDRYPNVMNVDKVGLSNSYFVGASYDLAKIILDTHANREAESIYLIPNYFVQPTAYSIPLKKSDVMCSLETVYEQAIDEPMVSHPNGEAHKAWAYQVYCWLKYTMI